MTRNRQSWHPTAATRANSVPAAPVIGLVQKSPTIAQLFTGGSDWSPANTSLSGVMAGNLLISCGGWWDSAHGTGGTQSLPTSNNGTFSAARNPTLPSFTPPPGWPVHGQIGYIAAAAAGGHTVTPQNIGGSGDGYFFIAEFSAPGGSAWTLVDSGDALARSGTQGGVDGVTVNTDGAAAQVGDLVVAVSVTDGDPTAIGVGAPSGYPNELLLTVTTSSNIGVGVGWKICTVAGQQSAAWAWADNDCEIGCGLIAVFRRS